MGYHFNEFAQSCSAEHSIAQLQINHDFTVKLPTLMHLSLEPGFEDYCFLDQAAADSVHSLDAQIHSTHHNWMHHMMRLMSCLLVSWGYLHSVSFSNSRLQLASSIKSHKLGWKSKVLPLPVPQGSTMSASKLMHHFSSHLVAFGFRASLPPDDITVSPANRNTD